jgi:hypothetical protein
METPGSAAGAVPSSSSTPDSARFVSTGLQNNDIALDRLHPKGTAMGACAGARAAGWPQTRECQNAGTSPEADVPIGVPAFLGNSWITGSPGQAG